MTTSSIGAYLSGDLVALAVQAEGLFGVLEIDARVEGMPPDAGIGHGINRLQADRVALAEHAGAANGGHAAVR